MADKIGKEEVVVASDFCWGIRARSTVRVILASANGWVLLKTEPTSGCRGHRVSPGSVLAQWN